MRKLIKPTALVAVLGSLVYAGAGGETKPSEPDLKTCERALQLLSKGDRAGFEMLFEQWPDKSESGRATTAGLADAQAPVIQGAIKALGEASYGVELVAAEQVGQILRRYSYVCKYQKGCLRWSFTFYRPADEWRFQSYDFGGGEQDLFDKCGREVPLSEGSEYPLANRPDETLSQ